MRHSTDTAGRGARALVEAQGLRFESGLDDLVTLSEGGSVIACGGRVGCLLKMITVAPPFQGTDALGRLMTELMRSALQAGHETVLVFTRPEHAASFQALNFRPLVSDGQVVLLEHGPGIQAYFEANAALRAGGENGAVVLNGNPFTSGHLHLVEWAARQVDHLYLFVVSEDRSVFPLEVRFRLAREATRHLPNVLVLETSRYAVSAVTFPSYFLKSLGEAAHHQMRIDLELFVRVIAPYFGIRARFVGQEPSCTTTAAYNRVMADVLAHHGLRCTEIPRLMRDGQAVSATRVRSALAEGDLDGLRRMVPPVVYRFLVPSISREA